MSHSEFHYGINFFNSGNAVLTLADWSKRDRSAAEIAQELNGKLRGQIEVPASASREEVETAARGNENVLRFTEGLTIRKVIVVPGKLVNIVVSG